MANEIKTINDIFLCDVTARADIAKIVENYASKIYVDDKISNLSLNVNLDAYATKTYVRQLISNSETKMRSSLNDYVLKSELEEANYVSYNEFKLLQEEINTLKQVVEDLKNNGGVQPEEPEIIYGNIIISTSSLTVDENNSANFTIKLDKAPTQQQSVNISINNNNVTIDKTSLIFTSDNYNIAQTITVTGVHDSENYSNKTAVITINSNNVSNKTISVTINNIDIEPTPEPTLYTIVSNLTYMTSSNSNSTIESGSTYYTVLSPNTNYEVQSCIIKMNGIDITNTACSEQAGCYIINITNVLGNIEITAIAIATTVEPTAHNMLYNIPIGITIDNTPSTVENNSSYTAIVREEDGYELSSILVTMNGIDITNEVVSDYNDEEIPPEEPTVYNMLYNIPNGITIDNTPSTVDANNSYSAIIREEEGYELSSISVIMAGIDITNEVVSDYDDNNNNDNNNNDNNDDITPPGEGEYIPCTSMTVEPLEYTFTTMNSTFKPQITLTPSNTTDELIYQSESPTIVNVSEDGTFTALNNGECYIWIYCGSRYASIKVTVNDTSSNGNPLTDFTLDKETDGKIIITETTGDNSYFRIEVFPEPSFYYNTGSITWSIPDPSILGQLGSSGQSQKFVVGKNGTTTLTVSYDAGVGGYLRKKYEVIVNVPDTTENVDILYDNPTITMEGVKAKAEQNGKVQYFDVSYTENNGHRSFNSSLELIDDSGSIYYLALTNKGTSPFGKNGLHLDSGGWYTESSELVGTLYPMQQSSIAWNNFDMNLTVKNLNNSLPSDFLNKCLELYNQTFPALNMVIDDASENTIELLDVDDTYLGYCGKYADKLNFYINLNDSVISSSYGLCSVTNPVWLSIAVHELGHTLGIADGAIHLPSMYSYTRDRSLCTYLQPNDIKWLDHMYKDQYGIDITTAQEQFEAQVATLSFDLTNQMIFDEHCFEYDFYDDIENEADVIVECNLEYSHKQKIKISKNSNITLEYNIYNILDENIIKGNLFNKQLKIHISQNLNINNKDKYRLYLKQYINTPCSLINPQQGIKKVKLNG